MNALTRTMAVEYAPYGIRCNTIIVGRVVSYPQDRGPETPRELSRVGKPSDIAYTAMWLAADESEWITGFRDRRRRRFDDQPHARSDRTGRAAMTSIDELLAEARAFLDATVPAAATSPTSSSSGARAPTGSTSSRRSIRRRRRRSSPRRSATRRRASTPGSAGSTAPSSTAAGA